MKEKEKRKDLQDRLAYEKMLYAPCLGAVYPNVDVIDITTEGVFVSGVGLEKKGCRSMQIKKTDKLYANINCPNEDCTGFGYDLTPIIIESIKGKKAMNGTLKCTGKEAFKYLNDAGCSCDSTLVYTVRPRFLSSRDND